MANASDVKQRVSSQGVSSQEALSQGASFEHADDDGVLLIEEEFRWAGRNLEARASHLASVLQRYLVTLEQRQSGSNLRRSTETALHDAIAHIQEAGLILEEACNAYVNDVDKADRRLTHVRS